MNTSKALQRWNRDHFGYANIRIKALKEELNKAQQNGDRFKESSVIKELRTQRSRWESIIRQKSRDIWLKESDKNTKFFHLRTVTKRRLNRVNAIKDG